MLMGQLGEEVDQSSVKSLSETIRLWMIGSSNSVGDFEDVADLIHKLVEKLSALVG